MAAYVPWGGPLTVQPKWHEPYGCNYRHAAGAGVRTLLREAQLIVDPEHAIELVTDLIGQQRRVR